MITTADRDGGGERRNRSRILAWGGAAVMLLIPFVAMQFTREVNWTLSDFVFAGLLIGGIGGAFELAARASRSRAYRLGAGLALLATFLLIWFNAAVGIIGDEDNPANLMFGGVIVLALTGAIIARFRARGMMRAMFVAAGANALIAPIELLVRAGEGAPLWPENVIGLCGFLTGLWALSGACFRGAADAAP